MIRFGKLLIGGVVAALAGVVCLPALFKAGRRLRVVMLEGMGFRVGIAVVALADLAVGRSGAGRLYCFGVLLGDDFACWFLASCADFRLRVKTLIGGLRIDIRKEACVIVRILVGLLAGIARPCRGTGASLLCAAVSVLEQSLQITECFVSSAVIVFQLCGFVLPK